MDDLSTSPPSVVTGPYARLHDDQRQATSAILDGVQAAEIVHHSIGWANALYQAANQSKYWLTDCAGEHLIVVEAFRELAKAHGAGHVVLEMPMWWVRDGVAPGNRKKGPTAFAMREAGRCDIGLLDADEHIIGLVEIKREQTFNGWYWDLARLVTALRDCGPSRGGTLAFGVLGAYVAGWDEASFSKNYHLLLEAVTDAGQLADGSVSIHRPPPLKTVHPTVWKDGHWRFAPAVVRIQARSSASPGARRTR